MAGTGAPTVSRRYRRGSSDCAAGAYTESYANRYWNGRMTTTDPVRQLIPFPSSVAVSVHPDVDGDIVSEAFVEAGTGERFLILRTPQVAFDLAEHLMHACTDPEVAARADALREQQ